MDFTNHEIYYANRGDEFREFIRLLLNKSKLKTKYLDVLLSEENMRQYAIAFTSITVDEKENFEVYEQLGDVTANKFIVWYMYRRFPQLKCTEGVKIVARLRINYGAKQSFYELAEKLGFWPYITASVSERASNMRPLLEDVFESFIGVTEFLLDTHFEQIGIGNAMVYRFLSSVFDDIPISLKYKDLIDAKTRLKELFDHFSELGVLDYEDNRVDKIVTSKLFRIVGGTGKKKKTGGTRIMLASGTGNLQAQAQQSAAANALAVLEKNGYVKPGVEEYYKKFYEIK